MSELDEIRKRKLEELMRAQQQQHNNDEQEFAQQVQQLEAIVKQRLTKEAVQRYGNIKAANPQKAVQLLAVLGQLIQGGRIDTIDDELLKKILIRMQEPKKDFNIRK
ncbi:hypothetical protein HYV81_02365 [Candidatus Woesearchaeota archaeon]|nr:hypothetical protein [Candidatus Woesearchaeota archaeon]